MPYSRHRSNTIVSFVKDRIGIGREVRKNCTSDITQKHINMEKMEKIMIMGEVYLLAFISRCLFMWRHLDISSPCLFRSLLFFDANMWNFSARHKLHLSDPHLRALVVWTVFQLTVCFILSFFSVHIFFESSVLFKFFLLRKENI